MSFEDELNLVLPADLPNRDRVVQLGAAHLELIEEANRQFNLTRIIDPRQAAIKHVLDSVIPWRLFAEARHVVDAGTGAGYPGIPLALVLPETRFTLSESVQKKTRFVESAVSKLALGNIAVTAERAETLVAKGGVDVITARAVAPIPRALELFGPAVKKGANMLLYKGPDAEQEIAAAAGDASRQRVSMDVVMRYELPDALGTRTVIEIRKL